ncbi:MAG: GGDEF domain-containing protein [Lachnospiraceae bacterium]|nr:GGDEF domain-containing protein [Lachnospiraceae bacterium]
MALFIKRIRDEGLSVKRLNIIMFIVSLIIYTALFYAMSLTGDNYQKTQEMTKTLLEWRKNSYNLQIGSDYLTEEIRSFVATGDKTHLDNYFEEANVTQRREEALSNLKKNLRDSDAIPALSSAMDESKELMKKEYYAARLAINGYDLETDEFPEEIKAVKLSEKDESLSREEQIHTAIYYLFDEEYNASKMHISNNISNCLNTIEQEIDYKQDEVNLKLEKQLLLERIMTIVLALVTLTIVIITNRLVFNPLNKCVERIRRDSIINLKGAYEVRFLAKNYNLVYYTTKENENQLSYEANHDKLTDLYNRRGYEFLLKNIDMKTSALLIIDLDNFKDINDTYGHDIGDKVIKKAAKAIFNSFRAQDYVCRIGGDEFAVIMMRADSSMKELIARKVDMINERMSATDGDNIPTISCSVGVAFGQEKISVSEAFKRADKALYDAKENGRKGIAFYG